MSINLYEVSWRVICSSLQPSAHQTFDTNVETVLRPCPPPESTAICFLHFWQWRRKAHSPLTNTAFFSNCSGLLRCIKLGSRQFHNNFVTTSGSACAYVSFRKHGSGSGRVYGSDQTAERNRNKNIYFLFWKLSKYGDLRMHISILRISV